MKFINTVVILLLLILLAEITIATFKEEKPVPKNDIEISCNVDTVFDATNNILYACKSNKGEEFRLYCNLKMNCDLLEKEKDNGTSDRQ